MAELIHEYMARVQKLNAPERLHREAVALVDAQHQEALLTHPGWEWYRRQVAERHVTAQRQLDLLAHEIVYGNELGEALVEKKMRARGLQAEVHIYAVIMALIREAAERLTSTEEAV